MRTYQIRLFSLLILLSLLAGLIEAQAKQDSTPTPAVPQAQPGIQDNSFLIEEAYNQEDGVIQHISSFEWLSSSHDWVYTLTDEWPLRTQKHQFSVTLAATHVGDFAGSGAGWGDTALNYRYQLIGDGKSKVAMSPRLSVWFPTGDHVFGRGAGGVGLQTDLPLSIQHSARWVTHWNAGATWVPHALNENGDIARTVGVNLGQSTVFVANPRLNFLVETVWFSSEHVTETHETQRSQDLFISPGVRWAYNFKSGLQIVPGAAVPMGVGPTAGEKGVILYLSFEHPFAFSHSRRH